MKAAFPFTLSLSLVLLCSPASAGQIVRSRSGTRETVMIVDHGQTPGRPAIRVGASRTTAQRQATKSARANAQGVAEARAEATDADVSAASAPTYDVNVIATEAVVSLLKLRLAASADTNMPDIGMDPTAYRLRLLGAVPDEAVRIALAEQAMKIGGVDSVHNELRVLSDWVPTGEFAYDDEHVRERVERALLGWPAFHAAGIDVSVHEGITTLTGSVASADDRELASTVAISASGVYRVQNELGILAH